MRTPGRGVHQLEAGGHQSRVASSQALPPGRQHVCRSRLSRLHSRVDRSSWCDEIAAQTRRRSGV